MSIKTVMAFFMKPTQKNFKNMLYKLDIYVFSEEFGNVYILNCPDIVIYNKEIL